MDNVRLELLGQAQLSLPEGETAVIRGPRAQTLIAVAALEEDRLTDAKVSALLSGGRRRPTSEQSVRSLRSRLPDEVKNLLGDGVERWKLREISIDVLELESEVRELIRVGVEADGVGLRDALERLEQPLLPKIAPESGDETRWLAERRASLEDLRVELLDTAIAWAEHRSDPWAQELRKARPDVPASSNGSQADAAVANIGLADARELIGRERELALLQARFDEGARSQAIWGEGGIGKSDLALTFVNDHAGDYRVRWKLDGESAVTLREGLRRLGRRLGIASAESTSLIAEEAADEQFMGDLGECLRSSLAGRWLLFFDNVERPGLLEPVWKHLPSNGHVLITSQWPDWAATGARELQLWGLRLEDATALLAEVTGRLVKDDDLPKICQALDCHPMLLKHAGMTMRSDGIGPTEYLKRLRTGIERAVRLWPELDLTRRHAVTTYRLAIDRATEEAAGAGSLIEVVSFMAPELITETILHGGIVGCTPELDDDDAVVRARRALRNRSLIQDYQRTESFSVHGVMQAVVRVSLDRHQTLERVRAAVAALNGSLPASDAPDAYERRRWLAPHIEAVIGHVEEHGDEALRTEAAELASQLGLFRRSQSEWEAAERAHRRAVDLSRADRDRRAAAMRGIRLANVIRQRGRFSEAEVVMATALPALRSAVAADDVDLSFALTVQARILKARPDSAPIEALEFLDEALEILDRDGSDRDCSDDALVDQLSRTLDYSAVLLRQLGDYAKAEARSQRGFELMVGCAAEEWLRNGKGAQPLSKRLLSVHLRSLANLWRLLSRFAESREALERALAIVTDLYEEDHTDVGGCLDSLGRVQREYGDFDQALRTFARAREISDSRFGERYPHAATALTNIAITLGEMDRPEEALAAANEAVDIYREGYGDDWEDGVGRLRNEHTAWAVFVRAGLEAIAGDIDAAERSHREVLRLRKKLYGPDAHPHLASSVQGLADVAALRGVREEAVALNEQAREMRVAVYGSEASYWVAQSEARLGDLVEDPVRRRAHLVSAERVWAQQVAPDHPWLLQVRRQIEELG